MHCTTSPPLLLWPFRVFFLFFLVPFCDVEHQFELFNKENISLIKIHCIVMPFFLSLSLYFLFVLNFVIFD